MLKKKLPLALKAIPACRRDRIIYTLFEIVKLFENGQNWGRLQKAFVLKTWSWKLKTVGVVKILFWIRPFPQNKCSNQQDWAYYFHSKPSHYIWSTPHMERFKILYETLGGANVP